MLWFFFNVLHWRKKRSFFSTLQQQQQKKNWKRKKKGAIQKKAYIKETAQKRKKRKTKWKKWKKKHCASNKVKLSKKKKRAFYEISKKNLEILKMSLQNMLAPIFSFFFLSSSPIYFSPSFSSSTLSYASNTFPTPTLREPPSQTLHYIYLYVNRL